MTGKKSPPKILENKGAEHKRFQTDLPKVGNEDVFALAGVVNCKRPDLVFSPARLKVKAELRIRQ